MSEMKRCTECGEEKPTHTFPGNIRIIIKALNMMMNTWGETVVLRIAKALLDHKVAELLGPEIAAP